MRELATEHWLIRCISLEFRYEDSKTLSSHLPITLSLDSLSLPSSRVSCLLGPSGCGKSTLLLLLAGLLKPTSGTITSTYNPSGELPPVGMVFQSPSLLPWATTIQNALFGQKLSSNQQSPVPNRRLLDLFDRFGLSGWEHHYPHQLSGGMAQRVAIIRAIMAGAKLLLLDEPFSNSDLVVRRAIHDEIARLALSENMAVVLVTHDIDEAVRLSDQIIVLTPRPASVARVIPVDLERSRRLSLDADVRVRMASIEQEIVAELEKFDTTSMALARRPDR